MTESKWAIAAPGRAPVAIIPREILDLEVVGEMKLARMQCRRRLDGVEECKAAQGYPLREGLRAETGLCLNSEHDVLERAGIKAAH
jgi:hypothetical protein